MIFFFLIKLIYGCRKIWGYRLVLIVGVIRVFLVYLGLEFFWEIYGFSYEMVMLFKK